MENLGTVPGFGPISWGVLLRQSPGQEYPFILSACIMASVKVLSDSLEYLTTIFLSLY
jgi:hypothetical protein